MRDLSCVHNSFISARLDFRRMEREVSLFVRMVEGGMFACMKERGMMDVNVRLD